MPIQYHIGYAPGLIGWMVAAQTRYYAAAVGFGMAFECKVASEIAEFVPRHSATGNLLLWASDGDAVVGSIVIDGGTTPAARLRRPGPVPAIPRPADRSPGRPARPRHAAGRRRRCRPCRHS